MTNGDTDSHLLLHHITSAVLKEFANLSLIKSSDTEKGIGKYTISQAKQQKEATKDAILQIQSLEQLLVVREEALAASEQRNLTLQRELESIQLENNTLKQHLGVVGGKKTLLKQQLAIVSGEDPALKEKLALFAGVAEETELKQQLAVVAGEETLFPNYVALVQKMSNVEEELATAKRENCAQRNQLYSALDEIVELQGEVTSLTNSIATKENEVVSIRQENTSLQQQLEEALATIKHAQEDKQQLFVAATRHASTEEAKDSQRMVSETVTFSDQQNNHGKLFSVCVYKYCM